MASIAVEEGRASQQYRKFLTYILAHNVPELIFYLAFSLLSVPLALTPIQILSIDMGTDSLTAFGLGVEKPDPRMHTASSPLAASNGYSIGRWRCALTCSWARSKRITFSPSFFGCWRGWPLVARNARSVYLRAGQGLVSAIVCCRS